ncbi:hypothetical protein [Paraburkholderia sp. BR14374]|uniref:hypothetical protein n=1 Tax=Paraburkholderia sp. BR14374 TaxID=3237007 RepID=UPI0034CF6272
MQAAYGNAAVARAATATGDIAFEPKLAPRRPAIPTVLPPMAFEQDARVERRGYPAKGTSVAGTSEARVGDPAAVRKEHRAAQITAVATTGNIAIIAGDLHVPDADHPQQHSSNSAASKAAPLKNVDDETLETYGVAGKRHVSGKLPNTKAEPLDSIHEGEKHATGLIDDATSSKPTGASGIPTRPDVSLRVHESEAPLAEKPSFETIGRPPLRAGPAVPMPSRAADHATHAVPDAIVPETHAITGGVITSAVAPQAGRAGESGQMILPPSTIELSTARSPGARRVLERLSATVTVARQRFADRIARGGKAIASSAFQAQESLLATGGNQQKAVRGMFAAARAKLSQHIVQAEGHLTADESTQQSALGRGHATNLAQAQATFAARQQRAQALGTTYADRSIQTAGSVADQLVARVKGHSQEARSIGAEKSRVGGSTPEVAAAKAQAARDLASDTATKIADGVSDGAEQLRATGPQAADAFRQNGQEIAGQLGGGQSQLTDQLTSMSQRMSGMLQQALVAGRQQLSHLKAQMTAQLSSAEDSLISQLHAQIGQKIHETHVVAAHAINALHDHGIKAATAGDKHLRDLTRRIAHTGIDPPKAPELADQISGQVETAFGGLSASADDVAAQISAGIAKSGGTAANATNAISATVARQTQGLVSQTAGQVDQQRHAISGQLTRLVAQSNAAGTGAVTQVGTSLDAKLGEADQGFGEGLAAYHGKLSDQVTAADAKAKEPVDTLGPRVEEAQKRAEKRAEQSFLENQWDDFKELVSDPGFWAGLIVGLLIIVVLIAASVLTVATGGLALVLILAAVGAVAAAVGSIVSQATKGNFGSGFDLSRVDWGKVAVSALIGGLFGAAIGGFIVWLGASLAASLQGIALISLATGALTVVFNVITGGLENWDKNLLANMAFAFIFALLGKAISARFGGKGEPTIDPDEPPAVGPITDPWLILAGKYGLTQEVLGILRESGVDVGTFDRILGRGTDPDTVALITDGHGQAGVRVLDSLSAAGIETAKIVGLVESAQSIGNLDVVADLADSGVLERLLKDGFDPDETVLLVDQLGKKGVEIIDRLIDQNVEKQAAIEVAKIAKLVGALDEVHSLANSGNLENPRGLRNFMRQVADEVANGQEGKLTQLKEAALRSAGGRVAIEHSTLGDADVIDHGAREALQIKVVTSAASDKVATNIDSAARQLRGEGGEHPPDGYSWIDDVRITNPKNPMFALDRAQLLNALREEGITQSTLNRVSELRVTNGTGQHRFSPNEL